MSNKNKTQQGFTLIELAIVLVIIGLIISSVLVGQDMIKAMELRATTRQLQEYQTAVNVFIGKYSGIPGDLSTASTFDATNWTVNGDGNGTLTDTNSATTVAAHTGEMANFWKHLTTKELIAGTFAGIGCTTACAVSTDIPAMKFSSGGWAVFGVSGVNYFVLGAGFTSGANTYTVTNVLSPMDAQNIDSKIDDGLPTTGSVIAAGGAATSATVFSTPVVGSCYSGTAYTVATTTPQCGLEFVMQTF